MSMRHLSRRLAAALLALPLAVATGTASAQADVTVPGCYGAVVVVCNPTVEIGAPVGIEPYETQVPICVGSCVWVTVVLVRTTPGEPLHACYRHSSLSGEVTRQCVVEPGPLPPIEVDAILAAVEPLVCELYRCEGDLVTFLRESVPYALCSVWQRVTGGKCET